MRLGGFSVFVFVSLRLFKKLEYDFYHILEEI
jgi:hypothetical protein